MIVRSYIKTVLNEFRNFLNFKVRHRWVKYGQNIHCQWSTRIFSPNRKFIMGDFVGIGNHCVFLADITIGNHVMIASHVALVSKDAHTYNIVGLTMDNSPRGDRHEIIIEDDVWIGHGAIVLSGVTIGQGSIVAAGALVTKNVPKYSIIGVMPAKVIGSRFSSEQVLEHEQALRLKE